MQYSLQCSKFEVVMLTIGPTIVTLLRRFNTRTALFHPGPYRQTHLYALSLDTSKKFTDACRNGFRKEIKFK